MSLLVDELITWGRIGAKRLISPALRERLARSRRKAKRKAVREAHSLAVTPITEAQLADDLRMLGVEPGRDLLVHSAISRIGPVEGGAEAVIRALLAAIGPDATLVMPAYPMATTMHEWMSDPAPFSLTESPSRMGALTEVFRKMPGALRSAHPTHSIAALGPAAPLYTRDHHKIATPCAPGSPFRVHADRGGDILCLGTGVGKITSYHVIEDFLEDFPIPVYLDRRMTKEVVFPDGSREPVAIMVGNPRLSPWRVDNFKPKEREFLGHLRSYGAVREGQIGLAPTHLLNGVRFHTMMLALVAKGITIYHEPRLGPRLASRAGGAS
jgi:aminoglycoside 3-N-acetyltransferase